MAKPQHIPRNAVVVTHYRELNSFMQAFAAGHLRFLMVIGPAGTGKSRAMRSAIAGRAAWIDGNATAFGVYCAAFKHQSEPIVLDDVDALYRDANGIRLLKQLCQSEPSRLLGWYSDPQYLERRQIPKTFTTSSPVAIIANRWSTINADVAALEDRGHMIVFDPPPLEIHRQAAIWFHDQEVFNFISEHLHLITAHSFRTYLLALELKKAQMDWKRTILGRFLSGRLLLVAQLKADPEFKSELERVKAFREAGGGGRSTYFKYAKQLCLTVAAETIAAADERLWNLVVSSAAPPVLPSGVEATCFPISLSSPDAKSFSEGGATFEGLSLASLTGFIAFVMSAEVEGRRGSIGFVLNVPVTGMPAHRDQRILQEVISNPGRFLRYLLLILAEEDEIIGPPGGEGSSSGDGDPWRCFGSVPVLEEMVRAFSRHPEKIARIQQLVEDLKGLPEGSEVLPTGFEEVWQAFQAAAPRPGGTA